MKTLTIEQVLQFHAIILIKDTSADGVRDIGRLEAAVATQYQQVFGKELYPDAYMKAAAIMRGIIADHPFIDGNKRTAMLAGLALMELNGRLITAPIGAIEDVAVAIATDNKTVEQIAAWLMKCSV